MLNRTNIFNLTIVALLLVLTLAPQPLKALNETGVPDGPSERISESAIQDQQAAEPLNALRTDEDAKKPLNDSVIQSTAADAEDVELVGHIGGRTYAVFVEGDYAYIGEGSAMTVLNISNPASPTAVGKTDPFHNIVDDIHVSGEYAYVAEGYAGDLRVVDVSDPAIPTEIGYYDTPGNARAVHTSDSYAYVADGSSGLRVVDVSDPTNPTEVGYYDSPGDAKSVYISGSYAYVAAGWEGLRVADVSDPADPTEVGYYDDAFGLGETKDVYVSGDYTYVTYEDSGLTILRYTPTGLIAGRVADADTGTGIASVQVSVEQQDGSESAYAYTDASGYYTTSALLSGAYSVRFEPPTPYLEEYYDNFSTEDNFTPVIVEAPATTSGINAALNKGYVITGTVTNAQSDPIADVQVRLYEGNASYYSGNLSDSTVGDGTYEVGPLEPGEYRLAFVPPTDSAYTLQWYDGSDTYAESTVVTVPHAAPINVELSHGSRITGVVTGPDDMPLSGVSVNFYEAGASASNLTWAVSTDANGQYLSPGLAPGAYQVNFYDVSNQVRQWYDDQSTQADATVISVTAGVTRTNVNAQLEAGATGSITGTITAADTGQLLTDVWMCRYQDNPEDMFCGMWGYHDGEFVISGWEAGQYHLYFNPPAPYAPVFYNDAYTPENATPITITANMTTTDINQVIQIGGSITGTATVTGSSVGVAGTKVVVSPTSSIQIMGGPGSWSSLRTHTAYVEADGDYRVDGLPTGTYNVDFIPPAPYLSTASSPVSVVLGEVTSDIHTSLSEGSVITGVITAVDTGKSPLGATATVYNAANEVVASIPADMDGHYTTPGLSAGEYKVMFSSDSEYLSEWNGDAASFETALPISVPTTGTVSNVNAALEKGGTFSGFIYDQETGFPLPFSNIKFYDAATKTLMGTVYDNGWGYYKTTGLPAGQYKAVFTKDGYVSRWYDNASSFETADSIMIELAQDTPSINGYLATGTQIYLPLVVRNS